ncbi:putative ribonuclease H-like domain-containing protein [Tanacetum coccineum]
MLEFCGEKGIKQEFSNARTPQQNGVAERMNRTLIEAARTMLADSHLPTTFWAEAVNTACYTFNRVRVTKPQNKTPYELLFGHKPILSYIRPFGCHVTILNTLSPLGKFDGKSDEGFLVGYSVNSKAFRVYNLVTKRVEVNLHVNFLEEKPNVQGIGHRWMFDLDYLTDSMNYIPVSLQNQANPAGSKEVIDIDVQTEEAADLMVVSSTSLTGATRKAAVSEKIAKKKTHSPKQPSSTPISKSADDIMTFRKELDALALKHLGPVPATAPTSTNPVNTGSDNLNTGFEEVTPGNIEAISPSADHEEEVFSDADDDEMPEIRIYDKSSEGIFEKASYDDDGVITDFNNLPDEVDVSTNHTLRIHNAHPQSQILGDPNTPVQTRSSLKKITEAHALVSYIQAQQRSNHKDQQHCLFACFLSQSEPRKVSEALEDKSWVEAMQEELLQFKLQHVWVLVDLPNGAKVIGTKWVYRNKKDERGVVVRNKARLVAQGHRQEEGIDYDEVFAPVARLEAIRLFLAFASYMGFIVYQMDVKSAFLYGTIEEEVYVSQPPGFVGFVDPETSSKVEAYDSRGALDKTYHLKKKRISMLVQCLQVKQNKEGIFISQDKYVADMLKKFDLVNVKAAITPMETKLPLTKDEEAFEVTPKTSHLNAVKRIFKYLKGKPNLGLWYPRDSPLDLEAFSDSDYGGSNLDRKSTTGGCQFLGQRLISWQCKKQTIVATSTTEAEYVTTWSEKSDARSTWAWKRIIGQFGRLATARTLADGTQQLDETIDTIVYTSLKTSVGRQLQLQMLQGFICGKMRKIFCRIAKFMRLILERQKRVQRRKRKEPMMNVSGLQAKVQESKTSKERLDKYKRKEADREALAKRISVTLQARLNEIRFLQDKLQQEEREIILLKIEQSFCMTHLLPKEFLAGTKKCWLPEGFDRAALERSDDYVLSSYGFVFPMLWKADYLGQKEVLSTNVGMKLHSDHGVRRKVFECWYITKQQSGHFGLPYLTDIRTILVQEQKAAGKDPSKIVKAIKSIDGVMVCQKYMVAKELTTPELSPDSGIRTPLSRVRSKCLELKLESEEESSMALREKGFECWLTTTQNGLWFTCLKNIRTNSPRAKTAAWPEQRLQFDTWDLQLSGAKELHYSRGEQMPLFSVVRRSSRLSLDLPQHREYRKC